MHRSSVQNSRIHRMLDPMVHMCGTVVCSIDNGTISVCEEMLGVGGMRLVGREGVWGSLVFRKAAPRVFWWCVISSHPESWSFLLTTSRVVGFLAH